MMAAAGFPETPVGYYRTIWRRIQEDFVLHQWEATTFVPEVRRGSSGITGVLISP